MTVAYISSATVSSRWVAWEVAKSKELGKTVVAVYAGDKPPANLPSWIGEHGVKIVPWSKLARTLKPPS